MPTRSGRGNSDPIAVVGMGAVFPDAPDVDTFWANVMAGHDAITDAPASRLDEIFFSAGASSAADRFPTRRGGFIDSLAFDPARFGIMPVAAEAADPDQLIALTVAAAAIDDVMPGDGVLGQVDRRRVGVVIGRGGYLSAGQARLDQRVRVANQLAESLRGLLPDLASETVDEVRFEFQRLLGPLRPEGAIGLVPNLAASRIANRLDLSGPAYTLDAACASSLVAVDQGVMELRAGRCDLMVVGGVHHCHDVTLWSVFSQLGALSRSGSIQPFSRAADGILIGEGTGMLVLERLSDATRLGHRVYAVVRGTGVASDGRQSTPMSPSVEGQVLALSRAYDDAGVDPSTVGLVEAHGTATLAGDAAELETLRTVFGPRTGNPAVLGSVKSMIGHAMPASGSASMIKSVLSVYHAVRPPTLHAPDDPHPEVATAGFRLIDTAEPWPDSGPRRAGVNAFGFGGINAHVIVEEFGAGPSSRPTRSSARTPARSVAPSSPSSVALFAGADVEEVAVAVTGWQDGGPVPPPQGPVRLAVVDPSPRRLELARRVLSRGRPWRGRDDLWFEPEGLLTAGGRVAFVYPGVEPAFDPQVDDVIEHFGFEPITFPRDSSAIERHGRGLVAVGRLLTEALAAFGVVPDDIAGHSLGEWTGMVTSQMIPPGEVDAEIERLQPGGIAVADAVYVALGCGVGVATQLIDGVEDVVVSHDNCPHQSVICGTSAAMAVVTPRIAARGVISQELPFRSGFHSPLFAPHLTPLLSHLANAPLQDPVVPMWSATTGQRYPTTREAISKLAADHLLGPVRFRELVQNLHADGVRVFVQMGVGSLTGFIEDTLKGADHLTVAANVSTRGGLAQLRRVAAALWVEGAEVDFAALTGSPRAGSSSAPLVRLALGAPLIRLPAMAVKTQAMEVSGTDPIEQAVAALVDEAQQAGRDVLLALRAGRDGAAVPSGGEVRIRVGLDTHPWLADHGFFRQPDGAAYDQDRFRVVPMTAMIEMMRDAAVGHRPDMVAVAVNDVRALRWLAVDQPVEVTVLTVPESDDSVRVTIVDYARCTVRLCPRYPSPPLPSTPALEGRRPPPHSASEMYRQRRMFHGPRFQGVRRIAAVGDDGIDGDIEMLPSTGAFLDQTGQLHGYWIQIAATENFFAVPIRIDRLEWYGPYPPPGTIVQARVRIRDMGDREVRADHELVVGGSVIVRITGWTDRRFDSDAEVQHALHWPETSTVSTRLTPSVSVVEEKWPDAASREMIMRRYLNASERILHERRNPRSQRHSLLGRVAAKDAVRHYLWDRGHPAIYPAELTITNDDLGRPLVTGPGTEELSVSIAHAERVGAALVDRRASVGIDIEAVDSRGPAFDKFVLTDAESRVMAGHVARDRDGWLTRSWVAKEAVAKATGRGLAGRPGDFEITAIDGDRLLVGDRWVTTVVYRGTLGDYVVGWTELPETDD